MFIGRSFAKMVFKSKMATTVGQSLTLDPMGNTLKDLFLGKDYDS